MKKNIKWALLSFFALFKLPVYANTQINISGDSSDTTTCAYEYLQNVVSTPNGDQIAQNTINIKALVTDDQRAKEIAQKLKSEFGKSIKVEVIDIGKLSHGTQDTIAK